MPVPDAVNEIMLRTKMFQRLKDYVKDRHSCCSDGKKTALAKLRKLDYQGMRKEYESVFRETIEATLKKENPAK